MQPLLNIAVGAARAAGNHIMRYHDRVDELKITVKQRNDFVTEVDRGAERLIVDHVRERYPDHAILGEEGGASGDVKTSGVRWIIDPLDGTTNFLHGLPHFAVSIAVEVDGKIDQAVVYNPYSQELYTAGRGRGASLDGRRIRVSSTKQLEGALLGTGFPYRMDQDLDGYMNLLTEVMSQTAGIRRAGAAALDLAYVAAGRLDAYWEIGVKPWDIAAGMLLVQEAGGMAGELTGSGDALKTGNILAGNPKVYEALGGTIMRHMRKK